MRRCLRIARLGVRSASTATKTKPSWQYDSPAQAASLPQSRSWARPAEAPSTPSTKTRNWARPSDAQPSPKRRSWARPEPKAPAPGPSALGELPDPIRRMHARDRDRGTPPHSTTRDTQQARSVNNREQGGSMWKRGPDRVEEQTKRTAKSDGQQQQQQRQRVGPEIELTWRTAEDREDGRGGRSRQNRAQYKDRGSLVSRWESDVEIPSQHRTSRADAKGKEKEKTRVAKEKAPKPVNVDVYIPSVVSVGTLARLLNVRLDTLRRKMIRVGMEAESAHDHILTAEYASLLAMELNRNPVVNDEAAFDIYPPPPHPEPHTLPARPPVVTIMGHVDHGKTTLLDTLRSTSVAKGEAGGITQHIGAFSVPVPTTDGSSEPTRSITFLDTPGHAAFSAMRARGASVTDVVVLVVAADDGIMPQTREVLDLVKNSKVGLVVAINKIDKPEADITKVEHALLAEGVQLETFGGDIPSVPVSGLTGQGLDQLVETISVLAEMQDLRAECEGPIHGYVLESKITKGLGPTATVLVLRGELKPSQSLICGNVSAKVRLLHDSNGKPVKIAHPGMAVTVTGWKELPNAGDEVLTGSDADIKKALANRERKAEMEATLVDLEAINEQRRERREAEDAEESTARESGPKELKLIIKGDVSGSVEAVVNALEVIGNDLAKTKIVATGVGDVLESDVMRAKAADGLIIAFNVKAPRPVEAAAASQQVPVLSSSVIYKLMDAVTERVAALLPPVIEKRVTGEATVLQLFDIQVKGKRTTQVGGCRVSKGVVEKSKLARVVRNGEVVHEGRLEALRQHKSEVTEVSKGIECGLNLADFNDLRVGDVVEMYEEVSRPATL